MSHNMYMSYRAVACIQKPPEERTDEEIGGLVPWLRNMSRVLADAKHEILVDILRNCEYSRRPPDHVIIRQGELGDTFYIILSGRVGIFINTDLSEGGPGLANGGGADQRASPNDEASNRAALGNYIRSLEAGSAFGELALLNRDCIRNASCIAEGPEVTELIVINRALFDRSIKSAAEADLKSRTDFVTGCALFDGWKPHLQRQAAMSLVRERYPFDRPIIRQGEPFAGLVFLTSGQLKYVVEPAMHESQYPQLRLRKFCSVEAIRANREQAAIDRRAETIAQHLRSADEESAAANGARRGSKGSSREKLLVRNLKNSMSQRAEHARIEQEVRQTPRGGNASGLQAFVAKRPVDFAIVDAPDIIGELEVAFELASYAQTAICTEECACFVLGAKDFERLVTRRNPSCLSFLRDSADRKLRMRLARLERALESSVSSQVPHVPLVHALVQRLDDEAEQCGAARGRMGKRNSVQF